MSVIFLFFVLLFWGVGGEVQFALANANNNNSFFCLYFICLTSARDQSKYHSHVSHHSRYWVRAKENKTCSIMTSCREKEPEPFLLIHCLSPLPSCPSHAPLFQMTVSFSLCVMLPVHLSAFIINSSVTARHNALSRQVHSGRALIEQWPFPAEIPWHSVGKIKIKKQIMDLSLQATLDNNSKRLRYKMVLKICV